MNLCSECATPLTDAFYGYGDCGMHVREEYESVEGYRVDATDGMGDWEDGPTWLWVALDKMPPVSTFYMTKARCCGRRDLDAGDGESDYCPKCRDVMEPMSETRKKLISYAMLGAAVPADGADA